MRHHACLCCCPSPNRCFQNIVNSVAASTLLYVVPEKRYTFLTPPWLHGVPKKTSPYVAVWFCGIGGQDLPGNVAETVRSGIREATGRKCHVARTMAQLPAWAKDGVL